MRGAQTGHSAEGTDDDRLTRRVFLVVASSLAASFAAVLQLGIGSDSPDSSPSDGGTDPGTFGYGGTPVLDTDGTTGTSSPSAPGSSTDSGGGDDGSSGGGGGGGGSGGGSGAGTPTGQTTSPSSLDGNYGYQGYGQYGYGGVAA